MQRAAIDIVLLLPQTSADRIIELNRALVYDGIEQIRLDRAGCHPHISLRMGVLDIGSLNQLANELSKVDMPNSIHLIGMEAKLNSFGRRTNYALVDKSEALENLHLEIMKLGEDLFTTGVTQDLFCGSESINEKTMTYVESFSTYAFDSFDPHVTIGYGKINPSSNLDMRFKPQLAICHLGNNCTCKEILRLV